MNRYMKNYWKSHPKQYQLHVKKIVENERLTKYGMTSEQFDSMWAKQKGLCAICRQPLSTDVLLHPHGYAVDHDHKTGKLRGLLCFRCNRVLGFVDDNQGLLEAMIAYLGSTFI